MELVARTQHSLIQITSLYMLYLHVLSFQPVGGDSWAKPCPRGEYFEPTLGGCAICSRCPSNAIRGTNPSISTFTKCRLEVACPDWCSVYAAVPHHDDPSAACPEDLSTTLTPVPSTPAAPHLNITAGPPLYDAEDNSYTVSCTSHYANTDTPTLEWYSPSGELLPTGETTEKGTVHLIAGEMVRTLRLHLVKFEEGDAGTYMCVARSGSTAENDTASLPYVPPTPTPTEPEPVKGTDIPESASSSTNGSKDYTPVIVGVVACAVLIACGVPFSYWVTKKCHEMSRMTHSTLPLLSPTEWKVELKNDDFVSGTVTGLQSPFDGDHCVVIKVNNKTRKKVRQDEAREVFLQPLSWKDTISVWRKTTNGRPKELINLKMNCLKVSSSTSTSAVVTCPPDDGTFYLRYREENATPNSPGSSQNKGGIVVTAGRYDINGLKPDVTYIVELGTRAKTRDTVSRQWHWKQTFKTSCPSGHVTRPDDRSAELEWSETGPVPDLYYSVNNLDDGDLQRVTHLRHDIKDLIPGMPQVVFLKVKEDGDFRTLQTLQFETSGSIPEMNYQGDVTTDTEGLYAPSPASLPKSRKKRSGDLSPCNTSLHEVMSKQNMAKFDSTTAVAALLVKSLQHFFRKKHPQDNPKKIHKLRGPLNGVIWDLLSQYDLKDQIGIFDVLRWIAIRKEVVSEEDLCVIKAMESSHYQGKNCNLCRQACFLIEFQSRLSTSTSSTDG